MRNIVIVDYQLGNLFSVNQALLNIGLRAKISSTAQEIIEADALVLPGVGAFHDAMVNLNRHDLINPIKDFIQTGKPFMGVCLGLQLLFTESEEFGISKGLDVIPGVVKKFPNITLDGNVSKVPQIAWNKIFKYQRSWSDTPLTGIDDGEYMYFVHSFYVVPESKLYSLSYTQYHGLKYVSSIKKDNIFACQFHPEKSSKKGLRVYQNWAEINRLL